jgi:hypothetical protein
MRKLLLGMTCAGAMTFFGLWAAPALAEQPPGKPPEPVTRPTSIFDFGLEPLPDKPEEDMKPDAAKPGADKPDPVKAVPDKPDSNKPAAPAAIKHAADPQPSRSAAAKADPVAPVEPVRGKSTPKQLPPELKLVLDACHIDAQGVLTSDRRVNLGLRGTEGKHFVLTGELYAAPEPSESHIGGIAFHLREVSLKKRIDLSIDGMRVKRILLAGEVVKKFAYPMKFAGIEREKWHHFKIDAGADAIVVQFDDQQGTAKGPIETGGGNDIALAPGAKLRDLKVEIVP